VKDLVDEIVIGRRRNSPVAAQKRVQEVPDDAQADLELGLAEFDDFHLENGNSGPENQLHWVGAFVPATLDKVCWHWKCQARNSEIESQTS
jgi:hypothetical protein